MFWRRAFGRDPGRDRQEGRHNVGINASCSHSDQARDGLCQPADDPLRRGMHVIIGGGSHLYLGAAMMPVRMACNSKAASTRDANPISRGDY